MMWIHPAGGLRGAPILPGDKSISHRYAMLSALCPEETTILNYSPSEDCKNTLLCLQSLGVHCVSDRTATRIIGRALLGFDAPIRVLDCGNSGTTIRLLSGILAGQKFKSVLTGDDSLRTRPMGRILVPLRKMGAALNVTDGETAPIEILGRPLHGVEYVLPVASAQVKSCVLLAGLHARGLTEVVEPVPSRSHTERALPVFGVDIEIQGERIAVRAGQQPRSPGKISVPCDPSAAAFFAIGAALIPGSLVTLKEINFNPARIELFRLLQRAGAAMEIENEREAYGEHAADLQVSHDDGLFDRFPERIYGKAIPALIDEIPILAVLGAKLPRGLEIRDAAELRHKECDRIEAMAENLRALGATVDEFEDGLKVHYCEAFRGATVNSYGDHRIAMALAIAGLTAESDVQILGSECVAVSYPGFFAEMERLTADARLV